MDLFNVADPKYGYNKSPTAGSALGTVHSDAARRNMSQAHAGKPIAEAQRRAMIDGVKRAYENPEVRERVSRATKAALADPAIRHRMGASFRGKQLSEEHRRKIGASHIGKTHTEESRKKMSVAHKGRVLTDEHKKKIAKAGVGRKPSAETVEKIKATKRLRCSTPEFRSKMSAVVKAVWASGRRSKK
jgi:hypothetical protein